MDQNLQSVGLNVAPMDFLAEEPADPPAQANSFWQIQTETAIGRDFAKVLSLLKVSKLTLECLIYQIYLYTVI